MTPALELPRNARGRVDAEATNRMVHGIIESWVREHPEQWLWLHDRWRLKKLPKTAPPKGSGSSRRPPEGFRPGGFRATLFSC